MAVSIALIIQAVFFGDGGILAIGANCFNMAVVLPYVAYGHLPSGGRPAGARVDAGGWWARSWAAGWG